MAQPPKLIENIPCLDGNSIDVRESNKNSPIVNIVVNCNASTNERFFDFLLNDFNALKLMTNALVNLKTTEQNVPIFLFSSDLNDDSDCGKKVRKEVSEKCKYDLQQEMRDLAEIIKPYQQMIISGTGRVSPKDTLLLEDRNREMIFHLDKFIGYSINEEVNQGFSNRSKLMCLSNFTKDEYECVINELLKIRVCSILQHICWCEGHETPPYGIKIFGQPELGGIKCPLCKNLLLNARFVSVNPFFEPLMQSQGGFLPLLIGWYLTKNGIEWTADIKFSQHEYGDIIVNYKGKLYLIENKIWCRDKNERAIDDDIIKSITQAIKHMQYWETRNVKFERVAIITNELLNEDFKKGLSQAMTAMSAEIGGRNIKVYSLSLIPDIISELISK